MIKYSDSSSHGKPNFYKEHKENAAFDIRANESRWLMPSESVIIKTGLSVQLPIDKAMIIKGRSGLTFKQNIFVKDGVVDSGYTGEIRVKIVNGGREKFIIDSGDRIAQALIIDVFCGEMKRVESIEETNKRGSSGFGSSGVK